MAEKHILHLLNNYGDSSIARIVERLVAKIGTERIVWHVGAISGYGDMEDIFLNLGAKTADFSSNSNSSGSVVKNIRSYIIKNKIDIVHSHTLRAILTAAIAIRPLKKTQHLATKHTLMELGDRKLGALFSIVDKSCLYLPDHLVAVSKQMHKRILVFPGMNKNNVSVIQNAIDCDAFCDSSLSQSVRAEFGIDPESPIIGCAVRIEKVKRLDLLLEGFAGLLQSYPLARLMIVGDGMIKKELEAYSASLGIADSVIWTGFRTDVPRLLCSFDVYVQTSVNEGLPLSILEAMAAGKAIIMTDVGGARELIENGKTGILIPAGSPSAICGALVEILKDPEQREKIALNARNFVRREFRLEDMIDSYRATYEKMSV